MNSLAGRVAVVTGSGQGIGAAIAVTLNGYGADVVVADLHLDRARAVAASLGERARATHVDVRQRSSVERLLEDAIASYGAVDIWINNAGVTILRSFWEIDDDEWDDVLATNLRSVLIGSQLAGAHLRERGRGRIINLASLAGQVGGTVVGAHYAASKAGIIVLTKIAAAELAPYGVTVNAISPAAIDGPAMASMSPAVIAELARQIPVGRVGRPEEIGELAAFLASDEAAYITGATYDINGGMSMR